MARTSTVPKIPKPLALLNLAIALVILSFIVKAFLPERYRAYFRF